MPLDLTNKKVWVAGHKGMVGSAVLRALEKEPCHILTVSRKEMDLREQKSVKNWIKSHTPDIIILAAAKVGGIGANSDYPAEFLYDNLMIQTNIVHAAHESNVEKLLFLGSSCIYPKFASQPIQEDALLIASLEVSNEAYAIAKIAGLKLCQMYHRQYSDNFISAMPCNLYGVGDTYDVDKSHVIPAIIMKFHDAKQKNASQITLWGSGTPLREFLYVDDLAEGLIHLLKNYNEEQHINIGSGQEISIAELAKLIARIVGYEGIINFDHTKPDGTPKKLLDSTRISKTGWQPKTKLKDGLELAYDDFIANRQNAHVAE